VVKVDDEDNLRFNGVVDDPHGRVFAGRMPTDEHGG
jgi:hypothetical protein